MALPNYTSNFKSDLNKGKAMMQQNTIKMCNMQLTTCQNQILQSHWQVQTFIPAFEQDLSKALYLYIGFKL